MNSSSGLNYKLALSWDLSLVDKNLLPYMVLLSILVVKSYSASLLGIFPEFSLPVPSEYTLFRPAGPGHTYTCTRQHEPPARKPPGGGALPHPTQATSHTTPRYFLTWLLSPELSLEAGFKLTALLGDWLFLEESPAAPPWGRAGKGAVHELWVSLSALWGHLTQQWFQCRREQTLGEMEEEH